MSPEGRKIRMACGVCVTKKQFERQSTIDSYINPTDYTCKRSVFERFGSFVSGMHKMGLFSVIDMLELFLWKLKTKVFVQ